MALYQRLPARRSAPAATRFWEDLANENEDLRKHCELLISHKLSNTWKGDKNDSCTRAASMEELEIPFEDAIILASHAGIFLKREQCPRDFHYCG